MKQIVSFLHSIENILGVSGEIRDFGISRILYIKYDNRTIDIGLNSTSFWINCDLFWPLLPNDSTIGYLPEGYLARASLISEKTPYKLTGDKNFDSIYLVLGLCEGCDIIVNDLNNEIRRMFIANSDLKPEIRTTELFARYDSVELRKHVHSNPVIEKPDGQLPLIGSQEFSPVIVVNNLQKVIDFVHKLEKSLPSNKQPNQAFNPDPAATINQAPMNPLDFQSTLGVRPAAGPVNFDR